MTEKTWRQGFDCKFTIEQIGRLEQALLALRESSFVGLPEIIDVVARDNYREILRIRAGLDAALGFDVEESIDLLSNLPGPIESLSRSSSGEPAPAAIVEGKLRAVDMDLSIFQLRQRPGGKPDLPCKIPGKLRRQALECLARDATVKLEGLQHFYPGGIPGRLDVASLHEVESGG